ncbi:MAG: DUF5119 domain-containing protein [Bacteroidales bacterium]|jgi:hypothetical protein
MKLIYRITITILILLPMLICISGCERRDILDIPSSKLYVKINWQQEKDKSEFFYVVLYPRNNNGIIREFIESNGGEILVPRGIYDVLIYSFDYESIIMNLTNNFTSSYATTSSITANSIYKNQGCKDEAILNGTDKIFYIGKYEGVNIDLADNNYEIEITPKNIIKNYEIKIKVINPESASNVSAIVSGFSGSYLLGLQTLENNSVSIYSEAYFDNDWLIIPINSFGLVSTSSHTLTIKFNLLNGELKTESYDIGEDLNEIPNGGVIILDSTIVIPIVTGGGIGGTVSNWGDEEGVDIVL